MTNVKTDIKGKNKKKVYRDARPLFDASPDPPLMITAQKASKLGLKSTSIRY